ncbi:hypothetical protein ACH40E_03205 [Streptomyces acidicola]|uniref:hypothetical protein n=1 Tax=Streptomyces acidicola TaxID=2596892 RepID=UPI0037AD27A0
MPVGHTGGEQWLERETYACRGTGNLAHALVRGAAGLAVLLAATVLAALATLTEKAVEGAAQRRLASDPEAVLDVSGPYPPHHAERLDELVRAAVDRTFGGVPHHTWSALRVPDNRSAQLSVTEAAGRPRDDAGVSLVALQEESRHARWVAGRRPRTTGDTGVVGDIRPLERRADGFGGSDVSLSVFRGTRPMGELSVRSQLDDALDGLTTPIAVARAGLYVPAPLLAALAAAALVLTVRQITEHRRPELALLAARGAGTARLAWATVAQWAALAVPAGLAAPFLAGHRRRCRSRAGPRTRRDDLRRRTPRAPGTASARPRHRPPRTARHRARAAPGRLADRAARGTARRTRAGGDAGPGRRVPRRRPCAAPAARSPRSTPFWTVPAASSCPATTWTATACTAGSA